jgi:asparagine synthase (glutamine-hydrolysing)
MCGFTGFILNNIESEDFLLSNIKKMTDKIAHRGPDEEGFWINPKKKIALGSRRLKIIDLNFGQQPFFSDDKKIILVYNGEIYNYLELRQMLIQKGFSFKTESDTEVLIKSYQFFGKDCVKYFNGMFAFALFDFNDNSLFMARDHAGIKPLYYCLTEKGLIFGSEIKAISAFQGWQNEICTEGFSDYLELQYCLDNKTMFKHIFRVLPGECLVFKNKKINRYKYWNINIEEEIPLYSEDYYSEQLAFLIQDAIRIHTRSDVPIGSYLSGGIDSSTVSILVSKLISEKIPTFTGFFPEMPDYNESDYAKRVSGFANTNYHEIGFSHYDFIKYFSDMIYYLDEPVAGAAIFPQFMTAKLASENVKVVLGGQGGDELFCGYIRYLILYFEASLKSEIYNKSSSKKYVLTINDVIKNLHYLQGYEPLLSQLFAKNLFDDLDKRYFALMKRTHNVTNVFNDDFLSSLQLEKTFNNFCNEFSNLKNTSLINKMLVFDYNNHLQSLLHLDDRANAAWSIESRVPLLDKRIVEYSFKIPPKIKFSEGEPKKILKKSVKNILPSDILNRTDKKGFPVPTSEWFSNQLKPFIIDNLCSGQAVKMNIFKKNELEKIIYEEKKFGRNIWGLLSIEFWLRNFF